MGTGYAHVAEAASLRDRFYNEFIGKIDPLDAQEIESDSVLKERVLANVEERVLFEALRNRKTFGSVALSSLWQIFSHAWEKRYLGEYEDLLEYATAKFLLDEDGSELSTSEHLGNMVRIVTRIFSEVDAARNAGNPFLTSDGEVITPDFLIAYPKIQEKLRLVSAAFQDASDNQDRQAQDDLLEEVFTKTKAEIEAKRANNGEKLFTFVKHVLPDGKVRFIAEGPATHAAIVEATMKRFGTMVMYMEDSDG